MKLHTLSDLFIQSLENLTTSQDVDNLIEEALAEFTDRVQKSRQLNFSKPINNCLNYIYNHLYEEISFSNAC